MQFQSNSTVDNGPEPQTPIETRRTPRHVSQTTDPSADKPASSLRWQYTVTDQPCSTIYSASLSAIVSKPPYRAGIPRVPKMRSDLLHVRRVCRRSSACDGSALCSGRG